MFVVVNSFLTYFRYIFSFHFVFVCIHFIVYIHFLRCLERRLDSVQRDVVLNLYDPMNVTCTPCNCSILELGHRDTCFMPKFISIKSNNRRFSNYDIRIKRRHRKACNLIINPAFQCFSVVFANTNVLLFVRQVSPQRTPPTRPAVATRAILASGCHTQQVIPSRACTTNCPETTTTTWRHCCHTTHSSSVGFTMYTPCICELALATMHSTNR